MGRTSSSNKESKVNKAVVAKIAEKAARKAVKKTAEKVARSTSTRVAAKVANETALNPDYDASEDFETEDEDTSPLFGRSYEEEEEEEDEDGGFNLFGSGDDEDEEEGEEEEDTDLTHQVRQKDIFAVADDEIKRGRAIRLQIKKNGHFLATIRKPYSEEQLQKDHGEGHYQIILRDDIKGTFIKQQSFSVAAPSTPGVEEVAKIQQEQKHMEDQKFDKMFTTFQLMQQQQSETQQQMIERIIEENRRREEEERERRREERELMKDAEKNNMSVLATVLQASLSKRDDGGGMAAMLQMMQAQQQQTSQMIMETNKNFMMMIQDMKKDTDRMMDKITQMSQEQAREFRSQLQEMGKNKDQGFDSIKMFEMLNKTRDDGLNFGLKLQSMAKELAAESEGVPAQPKGIVESVLDNLGKIAPLMLAAGQNQGAQQHFAQPAAPQIAARPALAPVPTQPTYRANPAPQAQQRPRTAPVQTTATQAPQAPKAPVKARQTPQKTGTTTKTGGGTQSTTQTSVAPSQETGKIGNDVALKEKIIETCVPLIAHALQNQLTSGTLGDATINAFNATGVELKTAVKLVSVEDIYHVSFVKYGLPDVPELRAYLKDYHDYLGQKAST
jgi:hypothetical protein